MRTTNAELKRAEEDVNYYLEPYGYEVKVGRRYDYYAIDIYHIDGGMYDTLRTGLTKGEAYDILYTMSRILQLMEER